MSLLYIRGTKKKNRTADYYRINNPRKKMILALVFLYFCFSCFIISHPYLLGSMNSQSSDEVTAKHEIQPQFSHDNSLQTLCSYYLDCNVRQHWLQPIALTLWIRASAKHIISNCLSASKISEPNSFSAMLTSSGYHILERYFCLWRRPLGYIASLFILASWLHFPSYPQQHYGGSWPRTGA